jgi:hypothetical protein
LGIRGRISFGDGINFGSGISFGGGISIPYKLGSKRIDGVKFNLYFLTKQGE